MIGERELVTGILEKRAHGDGRTEERSTPSDGERELVGSA